MRNAFLQLTNPGEGAASLKGGVLELSNTLLVKLTPVLVLDVEPPVILKQICPHLAVEGRLLFSCQGDVGKVLRRLLCLDGTSLGVHC
eukprot:11203130-Lingulodinium_polyedra.AAC.1